MKTKISFVLFVVFSLLFTQLRAETIVADFSNKKLPATSWQRVDADFTNSVYGEEAPALQLKAGGNLITGKVFNLNSISFNCSRNANGTNFKVQYSTNLVDFVDIASYTKNDIEKYSSDVGMTHISLPDLSSIDSSNGIFIRFYSEKASYYIDDIVITYGEETPIVEQSEAPTFSVESGTKFGSEGLSVSLSAADGATIYYNLNQTVDPTVDNAIVYDGNPIYLTSTTSIRAIAVEEGKEPSKSVAATYVYYEPGIESTALFHAENATELPDALYSYSLPTGQDSSTKSLCNRDDLIADNIMISFTKGVKDYTFSDGGKVRFYEESTLTVTPLNNVIIKSIQLRRKGEQGQYILLSGGGKIVDNSTAAGSINEWQGESDTRIMISNDGQIQFDYILVTYQQTQSESESISVTSITLDKTELSLEISQNAQLVATVLPENATDKSVAWTSSDESIAKVDAKGVVTAIALGEAVITATTTDGSDLSASCKVKIQPIIIAESITLSNTEIYLKVAETASLEASILPEFAANQTISWSTSDQAVATVDDKGLVTAVSVGEATITATTTDGSNLSASCKVIVKSSSLKSITIDLAGHTTAISCNPRQDYSFSIPWEEFFNVLNDVNIGLSSEDFYNVYDRESLKVIYSCEGNTIANGDVDAEFNPSLDLSNSHAWSFAFNGNIDSELFPLNIDETTTLDIHVICTPNDSKANIFPVVTVTTSLTFEPLKNSLAVMAARQETYWKDENTLRVFPTPYNTINPSTGKPFETCEYSFDIRQAFATENSLVNHSARIKDCGSWDVMFASVDQPVGFYPTKNSKYQYANSYALSNNQIAMTIDWSDDNHIAWDETNHNQHNAYLNLRNNASGIELINHNEPVKLTFAARYPNGQIIPVDTFNLEIVKPINFAALEIDECFVSSQGKSSIAVDSPFAISDYSGNKIRKNDKLYNYYGVKECVWHVDRTVVGVKPSGEFASASEVTKDSDGNGLPEIDTDNTMSLNDVPNADLSLTYENGELTFINADRFDVTNEYYLVVPVTIEHKWGKAETSVVISVLPVVDRHLNFKMAEFNGYFIDGTLPGEDGSFIKVEDPLLIYDDNGDKIEKDSELYEFYGVQDFVWHVDKTAIGIKPTGAISSKEEVFVVAENGLNQINESNTIMLSDMQSITISINYADGTLTYTNFGGLPVEKEFYLVVPVSVEYRWGKAETVVVIPVKPGTIIDSKADYIALDRTEVILETSQTTTLVATVLPESATDKSVIWTSSNEAVATVDAKGVVTAIAVGEAIITATTTDGSDLSASCKVTVESVSTSLPISVTPKDGSTVAELQKIVFEFSVEDYPKSMDYDSSKNPLLYNAAGEVVAEGHMGYEDASTYMSIYVTFDAPITEEGIYTLKVPEGAMREYGYEIENPKLCPAMELTYTIIPVKAESITFDKTEVEIIVGKTEFLTATVLPETTSNKDIVWTSSDEEIAVVNEYGVVTAIAVGEATITATTADGSNLSASCSVTVEALRGFPISIFPADGSTVGELQKIVFEFSAADYPNSMSYDSSKNPLLYNAAGEVVAEGHMGYEDAATFMSIYVTFDAPIIAEGVYTLKVPEGAMHEYGVENPKLCPAMELTYTIIPVKAESITLDKTEVEIIIGESDFLTATILPETVSNKDIVWTSSDEEIAVVNEYGVVTAIALGEATITATTTGGSDLSASCKVTVVPVLAMSIELDKTELDAMEMTEFQLTATVLPENTTNKGVVWSSSDNEIASVDETGLVKMLRVGSVVITATTVDGSNLSASCHITIVVGIDDVEGDNVIVATVGDNIVVKNAPLSSNVRVYAADGSIITSEVATDGDVVIEAPVKGIYIVTLANKTFKVMVK